MAGKTYYQGFDIPDALSNPSLRKIVNFYLFNTPVPGVSARGKKFADYGFHGAKAFANLKTSMLKSASPSLKGNYIPCRKEELEENFKLMESVSPPDEYCVFLKRDERTVMCSLFSAIRNAFAHGSFNVKSYNGVRIYFFLNYNGYKKAQIVLRETTLLAWIGLIREGRDKLYQKNQ